MKIRSIQLAPVILILFIAGIGLTMAFNLWKTESSKQPAKYLSGEFAGEYNPGDIRGSYSFDDISDAFDIPVATLAKAFGVEDRKNPGDFQAKELEEMYSPQTDGGEVGTDAVRLFTAIYSGRPYTPEETTRLPNPAVALLKDKLSTADFQALQKLSVSLGDLQPAETGTVEAEAVEHSDEEIAIKGKTTFDDLLNWGLTKEEIEGILGMPMGTRATAVRDFTMEKGLEFSEYKDQLQKLLDSRN